MKKFKFIGWVSIETCVNFLSWVKFDYYEQDGWFHRRFGFEWKELRKK